MRPRLKLELDFRPPSPVALAPLHLSPRIDAAALDESSVEDDFDAAVGREAFTEIGIQVGVLTRDNK